MLNGDESDRSEYWYVRNTFQYLILKGFVYPSLINKATNVMSLRSYSYNVSNQS